MVAQFTLKLTESARTGFCFQMWLKILFPGVPRGAQGKTTYIHLGIINHILDLCVAFNARLAAVSKPLNISQDLRSAVIGVNHTKAALFRDAKAALWIGGFF